MDAAWLIADPEEYEEYDLGPAEDRQGSRVFLVDASLLDGRSCLLAHKRYRPAPCGTRANWRRWGCSAGLLHEQPRVPRQSSRSPTAATGGPTEKKTSQAKSVLRPWTGRTTSSRCRGGWSSPVSRCPFRWPARRTVC